MCFQRYQPGEVPDFTKTDSSAAWWEIYGCADQSWCSDSSIFADDALISPSFSSVSPLYHRLLALKVSAAPLLARSASEKRLHFGALKSLGGSGADCSDSRELRRAFFTEVICSFFFSFDAFLLSKDPPLLSSHIGRWNVSWAALKKKKKWRQAWKAACCFERFPGCVSAAACYISEFMTCRYLASIQQETV